MDDMRYSNNKATVIRGRGIVAVLVFQRGRHMPPPESNGRWKRAFGTGRWRKPDMDGGRVRVTP